MQYLMTKIRPIEKVDLEILKAVIDSNELFPPGLLDGMTDDFFRNPQSQDIWLTAQVGDKPVSIAYCAPERMTEGTYNLYLIAVHKDCQGKRIGSRMMAYIENLLRSKGARILIVETSGLPGFRQTREFYERLGYSREAVIRDFYEDGDDKVVFWKKLGCRNEN